MRNVLRIFTIIAVLSVGSGMANAGIIITSRGAETSKKDNQPCSGTVDSGIIITSLTGIIITSLTGIIITTATGDGQVDCGIIITN